MIDLHSASARLAGGFSAARTADPAGALDPGRTNPALGSEPVRLADKRAGRLAPQALINE
ncbi:MAG: hypothetical protein LBC97_16065 [Bifidobacteriaceae bacterium]|nr:hypothetical protein [Bifidobacteriaceae bacterium]